VDPWSQRTTSAGRSEGLHPTWRYGSDPVSLQESEHGDFSFYPPALEPPRTPPFPPFPTRPGEKSGDNYISRDFFFSFLGIFLRLARHARVVFLFFLSFFFSVKMIAGEHATLFWRGATLGLEKQFDVLYPSLPFKRTERGGAFLPSPLLVLLWREDCFFFDSRARRVTLSGYPFC